MKLKFTLLMLLSCTPLVAMHNKINVVTQDKLPEAYLEAWTDMSKEEKLFRYNYGHLFNNTYQDPTPDNYLKNIREKFSTYPQLQETLKSAQDTRWIVHLIHDNGMFSEPRILAALWLGNEHALNLAKEELSDPNTYAHELLSFFEKCNVNFDPYTKVIIQNYHKIKNEPKN